jgi:cytochrome b subunit of formate dehydrogenase
MSFFAAPEAKVREFLNVINVVTLIARAHHGYMAPGYSMGSLRAMVQGWANHADISGLKKGLFCGLTRGLTPSFVVLLG